MSCWVHQVHLNLKRVLRILSMTFEVDVSDDANTTVLPTDGSCSHLGDRCQSEEASEDWRKHLF